MSWPATTALRDRFVLERRPSRPAHDVWRHQGLVIEPECSSDRRVARVATLFLTGRECPFRCSMCDLWKHTTIEDTPVGAIPAQITAALPAIDSDVLTIKLYNASSFFDPRAVPDEDHADIAMLLRRFEHVIVESHPSLIGPRLDRFLALLTSAAGASGLPDRSERNRHAASLEVAMGLETAHPDALERLHKRMTIASFAEAAAALHARGVALRVFLLISPPFIPSAQQDYWLLESIDAALACGASVISLIPTRPGNGTLEVLDGEHLFRPPTLDDIERSAEVALEHTRGRARVFVDLWDIERFADASSDHVGRTSRLLAMNLEQRSLRHSSADIR